MSITDPATLFGIKMVLCLALFLLGAAWLHRFAERVKRRRGPVGEGASAREALAHFFGNRDDAAEPERRLHIQAIRSLAGELERLDPGNAPARDAMALLALTESRRHPMAVAEEAPPDGAVANDAPAKPLALEVADPPQVLSRAALCAVVILPLALEWHGPVRAQEVPTCDETTAGALSDQAGVRCACRFFPGGRVDPAPAGYRWDCGLLRGRSDAQIPAGSAFTGPLPEAVFQDPRLLEDPRPRPPRKPPRW